MHANRAPLDDLGIFALMAKALALRPEGRAPSDRSGVAPVDLAAAPTRRGFFDRIDHWFWKRRQRAVEAHLGKATDVYDLEARIRDLERGVLYRYY